MSNGGAQHKVYGPYWDATNGTMYQSIYVYAWVAGAYSVAQNFWDAEDRVLTTGNAITSRQGGTDSTVDGYFDGDYNIEIRASDDATVIHQYPNVKITSDTGQMWGGNQGTAQPAATATNKGQPFATINAGNILTDLSVNQNTAWVSYYSATASGTRTLNSVITKVDPYNVMHPDWGAVADNATNDGTSFQSALTAIISAGGGILYAPEGNYVIDDSLVVADVPLTIIGDGLGRTVIRQSSNPAAPLLDYDTTTAEHMLIIKDLSITTSVAGSNVAIDALWPSLNVNNRPNFIMENVYIGPAAADRTTAYFSGCVKLTNSLKDVFSNVMLAGHDTLTSGSNGIEYVGTATQSNITGCIFQNLEFGMLLSKALDIRINNSFFRDGDNGIKFTLSSDRCIISNCRLDSQATSAIIFTATNPNDHVRDTVSGCIINGVDGISVTDDLEDSTIIGNTFNCSGTALDLGTNNGNLATGNNFVLAGTAITTSGSNNVIEGNRFGTVTTKITDTGSSNIYANNLPADVVTVASATALGSGVPAAQTFDTWSVTGTTTITSIHADVGPRAERTIVLIFTGSLTFTDGGNLKLSGNFSATADDSITLRYNGSDWVEQARSAN